MIDYLEQTQNRQLRFEELVFMWNEINKHPEPTILIFGLGYDSIMWSYHYKNVTFVEHNQEWIDKIKPKLYGNPDIVKVDYVTSHENYKEDLANIEELPLLGVKGKIKWLPDFILVDSPHGFTEGRVQSIREARELSRYRNTTVFIHDTNREIEVACCEKIFPMPYTGIKNLRMYKHYS